MRMLKTVAAMQRLARQWKGKGKRAGLVPTMGYLHDGHLSLVKSARKAVGPRGLVIVSIYVNPTQFAPTEDFQQYPRDLSRDARLCEDAGADVVFAPSDEEMYHGRDKGQFTTYVVEEKLSLLMEGVARPSHFRGVTTVVAKLFNIVLPDVAVFGAKDFQQAAIVKQMVENLNFPVKVIVAPTMRERDGLAMSSRNKYLTGELRSQATVLSKALKKARASVRPSRKKIQAVTLKEQLRRFIEHAPAARVDYIEIFDSRTLAPLYEAAKGAHIALAVHIGGTRLIDNARL